MEDELEHEILLIGDSKVGKTSILTRLLQDKFENTYFGTIGFNFKDVFIGGHKFCVWDTAGYLTTEKMGSLFLKNFDAVIVVFDVTDK